MKFTKSQKFAAILFVIAIGAGVIQYNMGDKLAQGGLGQLNMAKDDNFGEALYVNGSDLITETGAPTNDAAMTTAIPTEMPKESPNSADSFYDTKIARDQERSKLKDEYSALATSTKNEQAAKDAQEKLVKLSAEEATENKIEMLLKEKGFGDSIVTIASDKSIDVIVNIEKLDQAGATQIADTVARQAGAEISDVHIRNKGK